MLDFTARTEAQAVDRAAGLSPFQIAVPAAQPDNLRHVALRRAEARFPGATVLRVRIAVDDVERGDEVIDGVEGKGECALDAGALVQVPRPFNMLERVASDVTPEDGIIRYEHDRTQGPACAMAAGAATIFRNHLVPARGDVGQTSDRQLDGLADVGATLAQRLGVPIEKLWAMRNGYARATGEDLAAVSGYLRDADAEALDGLLRAGLHTDVEITDGRRVRL